MRAQAIRKEKFEAAIGVDHGAPATQIDPVRGGEAGDAERDEVAGHDRSRVDVHGAAS